MSYIPHSKIDIQQMLATIGVDSIEQLFDEIPQELRAHLSEKIPESLNEMQATRLLKSLAEKDHVKLGFIGAGAYEHHIPAAVWDITSRGEFMTAYTPYQAEASQGGLQLLYEYQTMMASLCGMDVSNASLYDGASALAEAVLMAVRANRRAKSNTVLMPKTVHPYYRHVVESVISTQNLQTLLVDYDTELGIVTAENLKKFGADDAVALIIPQPNFFGALEDVDTLTNWAHEMGMLAIGLVNPMSLALLKEPGQWGATGADIVCGEGQPLGVPLASGGPYFGFMCCKEEFVRQMPGRIIGRTVDVEGKEGFTLTLQAREQHIRRGKATSNICTNQGLLVTAATIYMSLLGPVGLKNVALACHKNTKKLSNALAAIKGVKKLFSRPHFHEVVLKLDKPVDEILKQLSEKGIQGGFALGEFYPELGECILVCATETKTDEDIFYYRDCLSEII